MRATGSAPTRSQRRRLMRERRTIGLMIALYCRDHHSSSAELCPGCAALDGYAEERLKKCVFGSAKPTCANCPIHCYQRDLREAIREVMRYAGPRMLLRHPVLAIAHLVDGRRPAPEWPRRKPRGGEGG